MDFDTNSLFLYDQAINYDAIANDNENNETICIHEAGHMIAFESFGYKAVYAWDGNTPMVACNEKNITKRENVVISMAGDVATMVANDMYLIPETCLGLYYNYQRFNGTDWQMIRSLTKSKKLIMDTASGLEDCFVKNMNHLINEYRIANLFFNMFENIPQVVELIDKNNRPVLEKLFGVKRSYKPIRRKLLDPNTAWEFCKCPNEASY